MSKSTCPATTETQSDCLTRNESGQPREIAVQVPADVIVFGYLPGVEPLDSPLGLSGTVWIQQNEIRANRGDIVDAGFKQGLRGIIGGLSDENDTIGLPNRSGRPRRNFRIHLVDHEAIVRFMVIEPGGEFDIQRIVGV